MNMLDALKVAYDNPEVKGARPVSWNDKPCAIFWMEEAKIFALASPQGLSLAPIPGDQTWTDWEVITDDDLQAQIDKFESDKANINPVDQSN